MRILLAPVKYTVTKILGYSSAMPVMRSSFVLLAFFELDHAQQTSKDGKP